MNKLNRYKGSLVGLAIGDALGTTVEFSNPGSFKPLTDLVGGGPFNLKAGQWTDDTSMALCLGASLLHCKGFNPEDQLNRYVNWRDTGYMSSTGKCFDIGNTVNASLNSYLTTKEPYRVNDSYSAGNGSLMRLAPIPLFYDQNLKNMIKYACDSSRTTHNADEANEACMYFGSLIFMAVAGKSKAEILSPLLNACTDYWTINSMKQSITEIAKGSYKEKAPPKIVGSGYVVQSMEAALWAFHNSQSFKEGALLAVNLGNDADTTGAIYGQLAGAYYGFDKIPKGWREKLHNAFLIENMAEELMLARETK